jgi:hypothetical protein
MGNWFRVTTHDAVIEGNCPTPIGRLLGTAASDYWARRQPENRCIAWLGVGLNGSSTSY